MKHRMNVVLAASVVIHGLAPALDAHPGPFDGKSFRGRIAYSADGNYNDEDDWAASPVALAIFAQCGVKEKLVHFDYNCILPKTDPKWEQEHTLSVLSAAEQYGYSESVFCDCQKDLDGALQSIRNAVNASSAENPLYFILAGPVEVPFLGIEKSDPDKRQFVHCISHNVWNDGYASKGLVKHNKRHVIPTGVTWVQITDQNPNLSTSRYGRPANEEEWRPWWWMRDSESAGCRFLWDRMRATRRADCSDAGMAYFLMTGNERPTIDDLKTLLDDGRIPAPIDPRTTVRMEAENFRSLEDCQVEYINERTASQRLSVKPNGGVGRIRTSFDEPYTAASGRYDVDVRYFDARGAQCQLAVFVNAVPAGGTWQASQDDQTWQSHTITGVNLARGDEVTVEVRGGAGDEGKLDFLELHRQEQDTLPSPAASSNSPAAAEPRVLDDPDALPGQLIVAGSKSRYLRYNGGGQAEMIERETRRCRETLNRQRDSCHKMIGLTECMMTFERSNEITRQ